MFYCKSTHTLFIMATTLEYAYYAYYNYLAGTKTTTTS